MKPIIYLKNSWELFYDEASRELVFEKKDTGGNNVDGTWGDWRIQEGEDDLFLINNRNGKKYSFLLKEVD